MAVDPAGPSVPGGSADRDARTRKLPVRRAARGPPGVDGRSVREQTRESGLVWAGRVARSGRGSRAAGRVTAGGEPQGRAETGGLAGKDGRFRDRPRPRHRRRRSARALRGDRGAGRARWSTRDNGGTWTSARTPAGVLSPGLGDRRNPGQQKRAAGVAGRSAAPGRRSPTMEWHAVVDATTSTLLCTARCCRR